MSSAKNEKHVGLELFSTVLRTVWVVVLIVTLVAELIPMPLISPLPFYTLKAFKALSFLCFGFVTPLAFWRFDSLGFGILFALLATIAVEAVQSQIMGHSFSWLEMAAKVAVIFGGFLLGLNARYDQKIALGPWQLALLSSRKPAA